MTGKIADWTPDRPPTPDEVEDAYRVSGFKPMQNTLIAIAADGTACGCAWGAIATARVGFSDLKATWDVLGLLGVDWDKGIEFMDGFDHRNAWLQSLSPYPEWRQAGVDAASRMFDGVGAADEQPNQ